MKINMHAPLFKATIILYFFLTITRYLHDFIYGNNSIYMFVAVATGGLLIMCSIVKYGKNVRCGSLDFAWILVLVLIIVARDWEYDITRTIMCILAIIAFFAIRRDIDDIKFGFYICMFFAMLSAFVTWLSLFNQSLYVDIISTLYRQETVNKIMSSYRRGKLCGLSTHYSCNAFYILSGAIISISNFFTYTVKNIKDKKRTFINILITLFLLVTVLAVGKRGHVIFFAAATIILYAILKISATKRIKQIVLAISGIIIVGFFSVSRDSQILFFFTRLFDESIGLSGREMLYRVAIDMFFKHPFLGNGYGSFMVSPNSYGQPGVHNDFLQFLCEWGVIGFVICCTAFLGTLYFSYKVLKDTKSEQYSYSVNETKYLIWSVEFQLFVTLYSLSGLPHYDFEIFMLYTVACAVPFALQSRNKLKQFGNGGICLEKSCNSNYNR